MRATPTATLTALCLLCLSALATAATSVDNVRVWRAPDYTRLVFDVSAPPQYQVLPEAAPGRIVVDLRDAELKAKLDAIDLKDSPVKRIRSGQPVNGMLRIVLDLAVPVRPNHFTLPPNGPYGNRLVIDLYDVKPEGPAPTDALASAVPAAPSAPPAIAAPPATPAVPPSPALEPKPHADPAKPSVPAAAPVPPASSPTPPQGLAAEKPAPAASGRRVIVAIDAGHGGEDPGAHGAQGTQEKHVVLAIARATVERMRDEPGMKPVLVRDGDYYVGLRERRVMARKKHDADVFVSIHADAFARRDARGASVFAVSRRGATSTLARYLADSENRADLIGGVDPRAQDDVMNVISDLILEGTMSHSLHLARSVLDEIGGFARLHKGSVEQAGFMVLKEPNMPSILVETGFISNPDEERLLASAAYQQRIAGAIVRGVRRYFERYPPPGTWFASNRELATPAARVAATESRRRESDPLLQLADAGERALPPEVDVPVPQALPPRAAPARESTPPDAKAGAAKTKRAKAKPAPDAAKFVRHTVRKGQSLGWLAKKYGVTQRAIQEANDLRRDELRIGETLKIPPP